MSHPEGLRGDERIHLVGIGGAGMSSIAHVLLERGHPVSGSDLHDSSVLRNLARQGARVHVGHAPEHVRGADLVAATSAAPVANPELVEARRLGLPVWRRGQMLRCLSAGRRCLAVAGSHGKTTTTAMIALILRAAGLDPSFIVGGQVPELGQSGHHGRGPHFVLEADEYDRTFLDLQPALVVVTNVEWDHVDCYPDPQAVQQAFAAFVALVPEDGAVFLCRDDHGAWELCRLSGRTIGYGFSPESIWQATEVRLAEQETTFTALQGGQPMGRFHLRLPGEHNVRNALAALAVASWEGVHLQVARQALASFYGAQRRFQNLGTVAGVTVVDDYAHHPTQIDATLAAARQRFPGRRLLVVFQPHTYSRTRAFAQAFARALSAADLVLVSEVYAAREETPGDISGSDIVARMERPAGYVQTLEEAQTWLERHARQGDVVLTLGAGDVTDLGPRLLRCLEEREERVAHGAL